MLELTPYFAIQKASDIAISEVLKVAQDTTLERIIFACFNNDILEALTENYHKRA